LRGTGALPTIIARIERQMVADSPTARGWYIECADDCTASIFSRQGFTELAVPYRQPPLDADERGEAVESTPLRLMYKNFGAQYATPILQPAEFAHAMHDIYRYVYGVLQPEEHPLFRTLVAAAHHSSHVPLRPRPPT
jgi:hypothetical protein